MSDSSGVVPLGHWATITMGQSPDSSTINSSERGLPFLQGCAEFGARVPSASLYCDPPLRIGPAGSILISVRAPVGETNTADRDYCVGRGLGAVVARPGVAHPVFLLHAIEQNAGYLHQRSQGSTFLAVGSRELRDLPVPALPMSVQGRIAEVLSTLDNAIDQTEALIAKYQQIKSGLMHDLFTRGITPDGRLRPPRTEAPHLYKESPLGWIPTQWRCEQLNRITSRIVDGVHHTPTYVDHGVPFVTVKNLTTSADIDFTDLNYVSDTDHAAFASRANPEAGDVLVTKDGTLGVARVVKPYHPEFSIFVSVALLRPIASELRASTLRYFFDSAYYSKQLASLSAGTGLKHIHLEHFRRFLIPLPTLHEQASILSLLEEAEGALDAEAVFLDKLRQQKIGLMHDLLTGRVRVKIGEHAAA